MSDKQEVKTGFLYDDIYLRHLTGAGHPERPERLTAIVNRLKDKGIYPQLHSLSPVRAREEWLTTVHTSEYVARVKNSWQNGVRYLDTPDVPISEDSYEAALMAAGGTLIAVDTVIAGTIKNAFCAVRPPGHHATPTRTMGFCLLNNLAVTAMALADAGERVAIVDFDAHHGNGTQEVFYSDDRVLFVSFHQWPLFPGTGAPDEMGEGTGTGTTVNLALPPDSAGDTYRYALDAVVVPIVDRFAPDWLLVSAGFDAHRADPLTRLGLTSGDFADLTARLVGLARTGRSILFLEGGYDLDALSASAGAAVAAAVGIDHRPEAASSEGPGSEVVESVAALHGLVLR